MENIRRRVFYYQDEGERFKQWELSDYELQRRPITYADIRPKPAQQPNKPSIEETQQDDRQQEDAIASHKVSINTLDVAIDLKCPVCLGLLSCTRVTEVEFCVGHSLFHIVNYSVNDCVTS
jgi:DUF438 domain-containing protein